MEEWAAGSACRPGIPLKLYAGHRRGRTSIMQGGPCPGKINSEY